MERIRTAISLVWRYERHLSAVSLAAGFAFDTYAFGRIDRPFTHFVFIAYLAAAGVTIALLHMLEARGGDGKPSTRTRTILVTATQFALGCLLSGFCVFYIRSASVSESWPFLLAMAAIFIGNEAFRKYHSRLVFSALIFFLALYSYMILLVPVLLARIGTIAFLISGAAALGAFVLYLRLLAWLGHARYHEARRQIAIGMALIAVAINAFYFAKILPPLPLVLSGIGVYHGASHVGDTYLVTEEAEPPRWTALFGTMPVEHVAPGGRLYVYCAIFAPVRLSTGIVHDWQWYDPQKRDWVTEQTVPFTIHGGRAEGYRAYSFRTNPQPGSWRVNIATADGRAIGHVRFDVAAVGAPPALAARVLR